MGLYLIIMGVQGAGKGTQAAFIHREYGIPHVSTGDLFRAMKTRQDELARRVQQIMNEGRLIDDSTTNEVVRDRLEQPDAAEGVIFDGYPRTIPQAEWLESYLASRGESLAAGLLLELDGYTAFKRAYGRVKSEKSGETYNVYFNDGTVDWKFVDHPEKAYPPRIEARLKATGEVLTRRPDDEAGAVIKRIDTYLETTLPLINHYRQKGLLVEIDASQSIAAVSERIRLVLNAVRS